MKFLTYDEAINQIYTLQEYVQLVNDYEEKDLKTYVIKTYTETGSIVGIVRKSVKENSFYKEQLNFEKVKNIILSDSKNDALHRIVKKAYKEKIKKQNKCSY
ncbi:hypothetical protein [Salinicoccus sp. Marseille-QA3877]